MSEKYSLVWFLVCFIGLSACYDENSRFGEKLVDSTLRTVVSDTSTVTVTVMRMDSVETSGKGVMLVGKYIHPSWGRIEAKSFIPYSKPTYSTDIAETVIFDSLTLKLNYESSFFLGDTIPRYKINIHKLREIVEFNENGYLYNTNAVEYEKEPIANYTFRPKPKSGEAVEIRLPDDIGRDFLTAFHERTQDITEERWEYFFKGLAIIPDEMESESLFSFSINDTSSALILYYRILDDTPRFQELTIVPNKSKQFNNFSCDATGTLMEEFNNIYGVEIPSSLLDHQGFLFGGLGWYCRLDFPYINYTLQQGSDISISNATLKIHPNVKTYSDYNPLPDSMYLYIADENNVVTNVVTDYLGSEVQSATLKRDYEIETNTYYSFDLTDFIQQEVGAIGRNKHNLQMVFNSTMYTNTFTNLTFFDKEGEYPLRLELTYTIYESN